MPFLAQGKTNWKYIVIFLIFSLIIYVGVVGLINQGELSSSQLPEIKKPEIIVEEELCFKGDLEGFIVKEITDESLRKLIIQFFLDNQLNKETCEAQALSITGNKMYLNEDEIPEYAILPECIHFNGDIDCLRGASGNGPILVFGLFQKEWKIIGNLEGNWVKEIKSRRTKGYLNLATHWHMSAASGAIEEYAWDGEMYDLIKTTEYGPETPIPEEYLEL